MAFRFCTAAAGPFCGEGNEVGSEEFGFLRVFQEIRASFGITGRGWCKLLAVGGVVFGPKVLEGTPDFFEEKELSEDNGVAAKKDTVAGVGDKGLEQNNVDH